MSGTYVAQLEQRLTEPRAILTNVGNQFMESAFRQGVAAVAPVRPPARPKTGPRAKATTTVVPSSSSTGIGSVSDRALPRLRCLPVTHRVLLLRLVLAAKLEASLSLDVPEFKACAKKTRRVPTSGFGAGDYYCAKQCATCCGHLIPDFAMRLVPSTAMVHETIYMALAVASISGRACHLYGEL